MNSIGNSAALWIGFSLLILFMLSLDLGLFNRKAHAIRYREAAIWSGIWVTLAMIFGAIVFWYQGSDLGLKFLTGYVIELSLSVDNLFVFLLIFSFFKVPAKVQHRVLFWGVMGALFMRLTMIFVGAALINRFHWILYVFGAFLVYTGIKMFRQEDTDIQPEDNPVVRLVTRYIPITRHYEDSNFFTRVNGKLTGTLLLLVLVIVEVTDLVFAVDSIPAIFAITTNTRSDSLVQGTALAGPLPGTAEAVPYASGNASEWSSSFQTIGARAFQASGKALILRRSQPP